MRTAAVAFAPVLAAAGTIACFLPGAGAAALPPVDLTGTSWHTEGILRASARGRTTQAPTYLDIDFLPDHRFSAVDPDGLVLTGGYTTAGARETRLIGELDPASLDLLLTGLDEALEAVLATRVEMQLLSYRFRARTNGDGDRLRVRVRFRFRIDLPDLGRSLRLSESMRTGEDRVGTLVSAAADGDGAGPLASALAAAVAEATVPATLDGAAE